MSSSPGPSLRKRANTAQSPTREWNGSNARTPVERPLSAMRSPIKKGAMSPARVALPPSPMPKFDLSTALPKVPSPTRTLTRDYTKRAVKDFDVPVFDFSIKGNTAQKPAALRRKPLMATPGQASSHISPVGKTARVVTESPDKSHAVKSSIIPESAVGLRVKQVSEEPAPAASKPEPSSRKLNRLKPLPLSVPLPVSLMGEFTLRPVSRPKPAAESIPHPTASTSDVASRVPAKPSTRSSDMRSSSESSARSLAILGRLSPGTKKHVAPQLLEKTPPPKMGSTSMQLKKKEKQAAQDDKSTLDGSGLGLSPVKAAKASAVHIGPAKPRNAFDFGPVKSHSTATGSPKMERQIVDGETFLVSSRTLKLQTKLQVSPRSARSGPSSLQHSLSKGKGPEIKPIEFGVVKGGQIQAPNSSNRLFSDSTSAAADDERGSIPYQRHEFDRGISQSEAHVLAVDPRIDSRKPTARRLNAVSDSVIQNTSKHHESLEYHAQQYVSHTLTKNSLLDVVDGYQHGLTTRALMKTSPVRVNSSAESTVLHTVVEKLCAEKAIVSEEAAYQAMLNKAHIDEKPKRRARLSRPRTRHRSGSSGQTQIDGYVRGESSSDFSVDFLNADASQKIILQTFTKMNMFGSRRPSQEQPKGPTVFSPFREPLSPSKRNFAKRVRALEVELSVMPSHGHGLDLSSDHPLSPLRMKSVVHPVMPSASTMKSNDQLEHFDDVSLDDGYDVDADLAYRGTSVEELDKRVTELDSMLNDYENSSQSAIDSKFVDKAAELGLMVEVVEKQHLLQDQIDKQLLHELSLATAMEMPHKSALSMHHRASVSSHKSVRWHPSIGVDSCQIVEQRVAALQDVEPKVVNHFSGANVEDKKSAAEVKLQQVFVPQVSLTAEEIELLDRAAAIIKASGGVKNSPFTTLSSQVVQQKVVEPKVVEPKDVNYFSRANVESKKTDADSNLGQDFVPQGSPLAPEDVELLNRVVATIKAYGGVKVSRFAALLSELRKIEPSRSSDEKRQADQCIEKLVACVLPSPKLNPLSPAFMPKNLKENEAWAPASLASEKQISDSRMSADEYPTRRLPEFAAFGDPAILSIKSPGRQRIQGQIRDAAILSASTPDKTNQRAYDGLNPDHTMTEDFQAMPLERANEPVVDCGDESEFSTVTTPRRLAVFPATQTAEPTPAVSTPGTAMTQSIRRRVIWDDPDEPGGREAVITSKKYCVEYLENFSQKYPLTGQKAKVLPKKRLEDLPKKYEESMPLLGGTTLLKPMPLATDAADIQQKLEVLLLKKKEEKVKKWRQGSGSGQNMSAWGAPSIPPGFGGIL